MALIWRLLGKFRYLRFASGSGNVYCPVFRGLCRGTVVKRSEYSSLFLWTDGAKKTLYNPNSKWVAGKWPATRLIQDTGAMYKESNIWRRDASYLRLKTLELGYTLPDSILRKSGISNIRFYINGYNLLPSVILL